MNVDNIELKVKQKEELKKVQMEWRGFWLSKAAACDAEIDKLDNDIINLNYILKQAQN